MGLTSCVSLLLFLIVRICYRVYVVVPQEYLM